MGTFYLYTRWIRTIALEVYIDDKLYNNIYIYNFRIADTGSLGWPENVDAEYMTELNYIYCKNIIFRLSSVDIIKTKL